MDLEQGQTYYDPLAKNIFYISIGWGEKKNQNTIPDQKKIQKCENYMQFKFIYKAL